MRAQKFRQAVILGIPGSRSNVLTSSRGFFGLAAASPRVHGRGFGLTPTPTLFSLKQDQSSSHRSAEHSSAGFIATRGTAPRRRVRTPLRSRGSIHSGDFTQ